MQFLWALFIPPPEADGFGGWLSFWMALAAIAMVSYPLTDLSNMWGCVVGLTDYMTGSTIVALGAALPNLVASWIAARDAPTADASVGNIMASTAGNVFLGIGIPWSIAAIYCQARAKAHGLGGRLARSFCGKDTEPGACPL